MKSDIEKLRDLCNAAIAYEASGLMRDIADSDYVRWRFNAGVYEPVARLGDYVILKPKKDL